MKSYLQFIDEANSEGLLAAKHLGDGVIFKTDKKEVFSLNATEFHSDIDKAISKYADKGFHLVEVGKAAKSGMVFVLKGKKRNVIVVKYGGKVKSVTPSSLGMQYANSSEKFELKPQTLGIKEKWYKKAEYVKDINAGIEARKDLSEALKEYLLLLVEYYAKGAPGKLLPFFKEYDYEDFPMNEIKKNFGELIGPLAIIGTGLFPKLKLKASALIFFPLRGNEPLMDFAMSDGKKEYTFSAKSGKSTTNTVKPTDVVRLINEKAKLKKKWNGQAEFEVMKILDKNSIVQGPVIAANYMRIRGVNKAFVNHWLKNPEKKWKYDDSIYATFVKAHNLGKGKKKPTWGEILYKCEVELTGLTKGSKPKLDYSDLFQDATGGRIYYINLLKMNNGVPKFETFQGVTPKAILRSKNGNTRFKDKIGVQLLS